MVSQSPQKGIGQMSGEIIYLHDFQWGRRSAGSVEPKAIRRALITKRKRALLIQVARINRLLEELNELGWSAAQPGSGAAGQFGPRMKKPGKASDLQAAKADRSAIAAEDPQ